MVVPGLTGKSPVTPMMAAKFILRQLHFAYAFFKPCSYQRIFFRTRVDIRLHSNVVKSASIVWTSTSDLFHHIGIRGMLSAIRYIGTICLGKNWGIFTNCSAALAILK